MQFDPNLTTNQQQPAKPFPADPANQPVFIAQLKHLTPID